MTALQDIKERLDILAVVEDSGVRLRRVGRAYQGFCFVMRQRAHAGFHRLPRNAELLLLRLSGVGHGIRLRDAPARARFQAGVGAPGTAGRRRSGGLPCGLVRWESDVHIRVLRLPAGSDPDDTIRADPQQWRALAEGAVPVMDYYIDYHTTGLDMRHPTNQQEALAALVPLLAWLPDEQQRIYAALLERKLGIRTEHILDMARAGKSASGSQRVAARPVFADPLAQRAPTQPCRCACACCCWRYCSAAARRHSPRLQHRCHLLHPLVWRGFFAPLFVCPCPMSNRRRWSRCWRRCWHCWPRCARASVSAFQKPRLVFLEARFSVLR